MKGAKAFQRVQPPLGTCTIFSATTLLAQAKKGGAHHSGAKVKKVAGWQWRRKLVLTCAIPERNFSWKCHFLDDYSINPNLTGICWLLNSTGMCERCATHFCVSCVLHKVGMPVWLVVLFFQLRMRSEVLDRERVYESESWKKSVGNNRDFVFYFNTLILNRSLQTVY